MKLPNDTKMRFFNAYHAMERHAESCAECRAYMSNGEGDICDRAQRILVPELAFADTDPCNSAEYPGNAEAPALKP